MLVTFKRPSQTTPINNTKQTTAPAVRFGINGNFTNLTRDQYVKAYKEFPDDHKLSPSATSIYREFYSCQAASQLLKDKIPTAIHVLGCSVGPEVYSYAISAQQQLSKKDMKDPNKIQLTGVDMHKDIIGMANTGYVVYTDAEKARQVHPGNPLADGKFANIFEAKNAPPPEFNNLVQDSPRMAQIERDPVAGIKIGDGMQWYRVKLKNLPKISFKNDTMEHYVAQPASAHQRQIYVLANSWAI